MFSGYWCFEHILSSGGMFECFQDIGVLTTYSIVVVLMVVCVVTTVVAIGEVPAKMDHDPIGKAD